MGAWTSSAAIGSARPWRNSPRRTGTHKCASPCARSRALARPLSKDPRAIAPPTWGITSSIADGPGSRPTSPIDPGSRIGSSDSSSHVQRSSISARSGSAPQRFWRARPGWPGTRVPPSACSRCWRCCCSSRRPTSRSPSRNGSLRGRFRRAGSPASTSPIGFRKTPGRWWSCRRCSPVRRRWRRWWSTSRYWRSATSIRTSTSRFSATSSMPTRSICQTTRRFLPPHAKASRTSIDASASTMRIAFSSFIANGAGTRRNARGWAGNASAARSKSSTGCCAAPPTRASPRRSASWASSSRCAIASRSIPTPVCRATSPRRSSASSRIR